MTTTFSRSKSATFEITLLDGLTLVNMLLRLGHYTQAGYLAGQLLAYFPYALPLHIGVGRALLAGCDKDEEIARRAIGHFQRVLASDPQNWRVRLEAVLASLNNGSAAQRDYTARELRLIRRQAPAHTDIQLLLERMGQRNSLRPQSLPNNKNWTIDLLELSQLNSEQKLDENSRLAHLYLRRNMPWMAVQYFEAATQNLVEEKIDGELKIGLLLALWLNGDVKRASAFASEMLAQQPQLLLPRLLLTGHLAAGSLSRQPEALSRMFETIQRLDPLLERSAELARSANLILPANLWQPLGTPQVEAVSSWQHLGYQRVIRLYLGNLDANWLRTLLWMAGHQVLAGDVTDSHSIRQELDYTLSQLENSGLEPTKPNNNEAVYAATQTQVSQKGGAKLPGQENNISKSELDEVAESIARVQDLLYGTTSLAGKRTAKPAAKSKAKNSKKQADNASHIVAKGRVSATSRRNSSDYSQQIFSQLNDAPTKELLRQPTTLLVTSERALISKYGNKGFQQISILLSQLLEMMRENNQDARLLYVDSGEALQRNGFGHLSPVAAADPHQIHGLINAALTSETIGAAAIQPNIVFIIGGPQIIPFWKLPNPTFDSDQEVWSDNPYGTRDQTYLLPERVVGRLPDSSGPNTAANLDFFLTILSNLVNRQRRLAVPHSIHPPLPMRLLEMAIPNKMRSNQENSFSFEQQWLQNRLPTDKKFLDKSRATQLSPFFYCAEAWKASTSTLHNCVGAGSQILSSPPTEIQTFEVGSFQRAKLLHFNLHGFRDSANWYGQSHIGRLITSPSLASLPVAFNPVLTRHVQVPDTVIFSEACYGSYLAGKDATASIALSLLARGTAAFVGSTVISYGSAGPELSCAGYLSYHFWREVLLHNSPFGLALQTAKTNYASERLAAGYNLTADDVKTLLEFVLLGDPTARLQISGGINFADIPGFANNSNANLMKGNFFGPDNYYRYIEQLREEEYKLRKVVRGFWQRFTRPKSQYRPVEYDRLPVDLRQRVEKILAWLLPDPVPEDDYYFLQTLINLEDNMDNSRARRSWLPSFRNLQKGGDSSAFADWFNDDEADANSESSGSTSGTQLLITGQRPLQTADGQHYPQTFHLLTDVTGAQIDVNLSKGRG